MKDIGMEIYLNSFFFFNDTATTEIYTLSLHDALPICARRAGRAARGSGRVAGAMRTRVAVLHGVNLDVLERRPPELDRKSTRLNSSHANISYAVFCLKKKK